MSSPASFTAGITGPVIDVLRANPTNQHRCVFSPAVKLPWKDEAVRYFFGKNYQPLPGVGFTLTGELGGRKVTVTVRGYHSNGSDAQGDATITELAAKATAPRLVASTQDSAGASSAN